LSSFAAFSENVRHRISDGFRPVFSRNFILSVITLVFPLPGPAVTRRGEPVCSIAASFSVSNFIIYQIPLYALI